MKMVQVEFAHEHEVNGEPSTEKQVLWVDTTWKLKVGDVVSFKGETVRWTVTKVYAIVEALAHLNKKWGLNLPKSQRTER